MSCQTTNNKISKFLSKLMFLKKKETSLRETIEELIEEDEASGDQSIEQNEREILENVLKLREVQVQDFMVPRVEIHALPATVRIEQLISGFVETQKSSLLIYQGTIDNILGVVYLKDVANWFHMNKPFNVSVFVREVIFVPPTMKSLDLLFKMRETGIKMAVVVDEYGGVDGLVSFRDIIEEVIGDIYDATEIKNQKKKILKNQDGTVTTEATATFREIAKFGGIKITPIDKSIDTIGGMISAIAGRVPVRGEVVICHKQQLEFEILEADPRKVKSVKIRKIG